MNLSLVNGLKSEIRNNAAKNEAQSSIYWTINDDSDAPINYSRFNDSDAPIFGPGPSMPSNENSLSSQPPFMPNQNYPQMNANKQTLMTELPMNQYENQINQNPGGQGYHSMVRNGSRFRNGQRFRNAPWSIPLWTGIPARMDHPDRPFNIWTPIHYPRGTMYHTGARNKLFKNN